MKRIKLTQGKWALVDDKDFEWLNRTSWHVHKAERTFYARTNVGKSSERRTHLMHIAIMGQHPGLEIDHADGDGLNNQRSNLRFVTHSANCFNRRKIRGKSSRQVGICWNERSQKWRAYISIKGRPVSLGYFDKEKDAVKARQVAYSKYVNL